ncbi:hypothetical protein RC62_2065 [Flavobacterium aquidurense]|uniref:Uncharacterized protein n=1 Tax=Flavobacterium aquidurense TaxID=362413 RepID=A0A0Q1BE93_9FLAO|nr:hypothetical protein RC62_2065 [Flavobacterium aquidurense]
MLFRTTNYKFNNNEVGFLDYSLSNMLCVLPGKRFSTD